MKVCLPVEVVLQIGMGLGEKSELYLGTQSGASGSSSFNHPC